MDLPPTEVETGAELAADLHRWGVTEAEAGVVVRPDLAERVLAALAASPPAPPMPKTTAGGAGRLAGVAMGRAKYYRQAFRRNDLSPAEEAFEDVAVAEGIKIPASLRPLVLRYALRALSEVEEERARRERGEYPSADSDPVLSLVVGNRGQAVETSPQGAPGRQDVRGPTPTVEPIPPPKPASAGLQPPIAPEPASIPTGKRASEVVAERIAVLEKDKREPVTPKGLRDYAVAGRLLVDLCGDLAVEAITPEVAETLVQGLARVPANHGKGAGFRDMSAREAIRRADEREAEALRSAVAAGEDPEQLQPIPRMSPATINKHLTSLQGLLGPLLPRGEEGRSALVAARFPKRVVRRNPTFERRQLADDRLARIFHGPAFTGFGDALVDRIASGDELVRDARYWVPLVSLYSGSREEEVLALWAEDFETVDGVDVFSIGAVHAGQRGPVKTEASIRKVPVHGALKALGLMGFVREAQARGTGSSSRASGAAGRTTGTGTASASGGRRIAALSAHMPKVRTSIRYGTA